MEVFVTIQIIILATLIPTIRDIMLYEEVKERRKFMLLYIVGVACLSYGITTGFIKLIN